MMRNRFQADGHRLRPLSHPGLSHFRALELSGSLTAVAGPSLAGLVIQAITAPLAIVLDALSYLFSALCVFLSYTRIRIQIYNPNESWTFISHSIHPS